jgi:hypothetical protein
MGHQRAYLAAVDGKHRVSKAQRTAGTFSVVRGLMVGAVALFAASIASSTSHAQSGPFNGLAGVWSGAGTVTLDDGSTERLRCRATYAVGAGGSGLNQSLTCASDSYKFDLRTNVVAEGGAISGSWTESSRGINGSIQGHGSSGNLQVEASAPGWSANISLTTRGNKQSVVIRAESQFKGATISLTRS